MSDEESSDDEISRDKIFESEEDDEPSRKDQEASSESSTDNDEDDKKINKKIRPVILDDESSNNSSEDEDIPDKKTDDDETIKKSPNNRHENEDENDHDKGLCDFDLMMQKKKNENRRIRNKSKRTSDIQMINDNDDAIARLISDMRQAARVDRELNLEGKPATKKLGMLPMVMRQLSKIDLIMAFIEANVLSVMTDWLAPLPLDRSLPNSKIRSEFLNLLLELPIDDNSRLKESGIGKAVMYLYRHPKETRENKIVAEKIITQWARPIFNLNADYSKLSREDRQLRDEEIARKLRRQKRSNDDESPSTSKFKKVDEAAEAKRPGDPGWICRARVPMPLEREYIRRPKWTSNVDISTAQKKTVSMLEKHKRNFSDRKKLSRQQHAMKLSLEGKNMKL